MMSLRADTSARGLRKPFSSSAARQLLISRSIGSDAAGGFMDLSKLVSGGGKLKGAYGDLAYKIGTFCPSTEPKS